MSSIRERYVLSRKGEGAVIVAAKGECGVFGGGADYVNNGPLLDCPALNTSQKGTDLRAQV